MVKRGATKGRGTIFISFLQLSRYVGYAWRIYIFFSSDAALSVFSSSCSVVLVGNVVKSCDRLCEEQVFEFEIHEEFLDESPGGDAEEVRG